MSYPYPQPPQQGWGPPPQQPQQPGGWGPPQQPQQPGGWGPPQPPQQGWGPPQQPQQPGGWGPPAQQAPEPPAPVQGSLADFFSQPSTGGGAALKFPQNGSAHFGIVNRQITDSDTEQQTGIGANANVGQTFKDGRPKMVLKIPLNVAPSQDHPDGKARLYANPGVRDQLVAQVAPSGAPIITHPSGVQYYLPEPGSGIYIQKTGTRPTGPGMNPANVFTVQYFRPERARQLAAQYGIEYPSVAEMAATSDPAPTANGEQPPQQPGAGPQSAPGQAQATGAFPAPPQQFASAAAPSPAAQPPAQPPAGPPPSAADFAPPAPGQPGNPAQWQQQPPAPQGGPQPPGQFPSSPGLQMDSFLPEGQPNGGHHIPQATPPTGPPPGMTPENQALMAQMTGRAPQ